MKIACIVPSVLPDLHQLSLMMAADRVVYLLDEPFSRKSGAHRGQICGHEKPLWLTMPVHSEDKKKPLQQVRIEGNQWPDTFMKSIHDVYAQAVYHDFYEAELYSDFCEAAAIGVKALSGKDDAADSVSDGLLLPMIQHLNARIFGYLELSEALQTKPEWLTTAAFNKDLREMAEQVGLQIWIEPRGKYYRQLGNLPEHAQISAPGTSLPAYSRGFYPPASPGNSCCLLDLLMHHGPASFKVLDELPAAIKS
jgi:hypothetical protein